MCASSPTTTSSPGRVRILRPIWFAIVPLGTKRAASLPSNSAIRSCSRLTVGSSPYWSSPTGAAAIAWRMPGDGRVTVSERRSMRSMMAAILFQLVADLLDAGIGACFVLLAAGRAAYADRADDLVPGLDRHSAAQCDRPFCVLEARHGRVGQNTFGPVGGRLPEGDRSKRLAAAGDDRVRARAIVAERCFDEAVAIDHRHADVIAVGPAFLQSPLGDG